MLRQPVVFAAGDAEMLFRDAPARGNPSTDSAHLPAPVWLLPVLAERFQHPTPHLPGNGIRPRTTSACLLRSCSTACRSPAAFLSQPCTKSQTTCSRVRFIEGFAPVGGWVRDPTHHVLGLFEFFRAHENQLHRRLTMWTQLAGNLPSLLSGRWMRNNDQQIHVAALVGSPVSIGTEEQHFTWMKTLNEVTNKFLEV